MVEPVQPFEGGEFDRFEAAPWSAPTDDLGLVETVDRFGEGIIITVADTPTDGSMPASASRSEYRMDSY